MKITEIQVFDYSRQCEGPNDTVTTVNEYSANVVIDDNFMIQWDSKAGWSIPDADEACWNNAERQNRAHEEHDASELAEQLGALDEVQGLINQGIFEE